MNVKRLFSFDGRIGRVPFWGISIFPLLVIIIISSGVGAINGVSWFPLIVLLMLALVIGAATSVKRWHDRGKSGVWMAIILVPFFGGIWAIVETGFLGGTDGDNQYGSPSSGSPFRG